MRRGNNGKNNTTYISTSFSTFSTFCNIPQILSYSLLLKNKAKDSLAHLPEILQVCHSKHCEETSRESLMTPSFCHSEEARSATEESLLSAKDSLSKTPKGTTSDSCRDSSAFTKPQNDKLCYPQGKPTHNKHLQGKLVWHSKHCEETSPESLTTPLLCHSERSEESLNKSLVAKRDSSLDSQAQNDKLTAFTRNPKNNDSQKAHRDSSPIAGVQNDNSGRVSSNSNRDSSALQSLRHDNGIKSAKNSKKAAPLISTILSPLLLPALFPPLLFAQYVNNGGQVLFDYDVSTDSGDYIINTSPTMAQSQDTTVTIKTGATISRQASTGRVWDPVIWNKDTQKILTVKVENNATINGQGEAWGVLGGYNDGNTNNTQTKVENSGTIEATNTLRAIGVVNGSLAVVNEAGGTINGGITVNSSVSVTNKVDTNETLLDNKGTITGGLLINSNQFSTKKVTNSGTIATITNYGNITEVLENSNSISDMLTNGTVNPPSTGSGTNQSSGTSTSTNATITKLDNQSGGTIGALTNNNYGTITTLENAGTIQNAFLNYGDITIFTNSGTLANTTTSGLSSNNNFKTITTLINDLNGTINFLRNGGSSHSSATITTLENKGTWTTLENSQTSQNKSSIVTFTNSGTLTTLQNGSNTNAHKAAIPTPTKQQYQRPQSRDTNPHQYRHDYQCH